MMKRPLIKSLLQLAALLSLAMVSTGCWDWTVPSGGDDADVNDADSDMTNESDGDSDSCQCTASDGPCCDGCHFLGVDRRCSQEAILHEHRCESADCGADAMRRGSFRYCSGVSAECPEEMVFEGDWEILEDCTDDQICVVVDGISACHDCIEGCSEGHCNETSCSSGPCCDDEHFAPATTRCRESAEGTECRCTSGECGADMECRSQYRFCTGLSVECTDDHLEWSAWAQGEECSYDQVCNEEEGCVSCEHGCDLGRCLSSPECTSGPCCHEGRFRPTSFVCSTNTEYQCNGSGCGADAQARDVSQYCSGESARCDGETTTDEWTTLEDCDADAICDATATGATCQTCPEGCEDGACATELELDWRLADPATSPTARYTHAAAFDIARNVTIIMGGWGEGVIPLDDTWGWDGTTWTELVPNEGVGLTDHAMAYDSSRNVTVLFGGWTDFIGAMDDTGEWDGSSWDWLDPWSPPERSGHAMVFDSARGATVLFGGQENSFEDYLIFDDTWEWDGASWTDISPSSSPPSRTYHSIAYDTDRGVTVLFGGWVESRLDDTWEWDGSSWTEMDPAASPPPRSSHAMAFDSARGVTVLFGGFNGSRSLDDTWEWDGSTWTEVHTPTSPSQSSDHSMAYDSARRVIVVFGGGGDTASDETWELGLW